MDAEVELVVVKLGRVVAEVGFVVGQAATGVKGHGLLVEEGGYADAGGVCSDCVVEECLSAAEVGFAVIEDISQTPISRSFCLTVSNTLSRFALSNVRKVALSSV